VTDVPNVEKSGEALQVRPVQKRERSKQRNRISLSDAVNGTRLNSHSHFICPSLSSVSDALTAVVFKWIVGRNLIAPDVIKGYFLTTKGEKWIYRPSQHSITNFKE
jgi:hypothetical protein